MTVRCKFKVTQIAMHEGQRRVRDDVGDWKKGGSGHFITESCLAGSVTMAPVYANDDAKHENSKFWDASPSGEFKMQVNNLEALKALEVGKQYYIDISAA